MISLVMTVDDLFDHDDGIYVISETLQDNEDGESSVKKTKNYLQRGADWGRSAAVSIFGADQTLEVEQNCGVRIQGGKSRNGVRKSFHLYSYAEDGFDTPLFPDNLNVSGEVITSYKSIVIRNGGNLQSTTVFDDSWIQTMVRELKTDSGRFRPVILFLNGELWGCYVLQTDKSAEEIAARYQVDADQVEIVNRDIIYSTEDFWEMVQFFMNNSINTQELYERACDYLDVEAFAEYVATEIYIGNTDWPGNNYIFFRIRTDKDEGKWRLMLYDTDISLGLDEEKGTGSSNTYVWMNVQQVPINWIFISLMSWKPFREMYLDCCSRVAEIFDPDSAIPLYEATWNEWQALYRIARKSNVSCHEESSLLERLQQVKDFLRGRYLHEGAFDASVVQAAEKGRLEHYTGTDDD